MLLGYLIIYVLSVKLYIGIENYFFNCMCQCAQQGWGGYDYSRKSIIKRVYAVLISSPPVDFIDVPPTTRGFYEVLVPLGLKLK